MAQQTLNNLETRLSFRNKLNDNFTELYTAKDAAVNLTGSQTITGTKTFYSSGIKINNPANTFAYTVVGGAIAADRSVTLPLLAGNDTLVTEAFAQALTNKTIAAGSNTITGVYLLASGGTLAGPNTITGTTTNIVKYVFDALGVTRVDGAGLWLANTTLAGAAAQQVSPSLVLEGQGWKTNATAGSQSVKFSQDVVPVQGAANPTFSTRWQYSVNGAAYTTFMSYSSVGDALSIPASLSNAVGAVTIRSGSTVGLTLGNGTSAAPTNSVTIQNINNYTNTSGTINHLILNNVFAPTSGTAIFNGVGIFHTINQTGGANGQITGVNMTYTITAAVNVTGIDWNPTTPANISGTHLAFRATSGNVLIGGTTLTTSAILDLQSTTRAFILPRMTTTQKDAIATPSAGMVVYDTTLGKLSVRGASAWETVTSV